MRNPVYLILLGLLLVVCIAFISVQFNVMSMSELQSKLKMLAIILAPVALFIGVFAYTQTRKA